LHEIGKLALALEHLGAALVELIAAEEPEFAWTGCGCGDLMAGASRQNAGGGKTDQADVQTRMKGHGAIGNGRFWQKPDWARWLSCCPGADGGTRTLTRLPSTDFKSVASTIPPRPLAGETRRTMAQRMLRRKRLTRPRESAA
jgi:hypothetical protein